jgi:hypothetical protein
MVAIQVELLSWCSILLAGRDAPNLNLIDRRMAGSGPAEGGLAWGWLGSRRHSGLQASQVRVRFDPSLRLDSGPGFKFSADADKGWPSFVSGQSQQTLRVSLPASWPSAYAESDSNEARAPAATRRCRPGTRDGSESARPARRLHGHTSESSQLSRYAPARRRTQLVLVAPCGPVTVTRTLNSDSDRHLKVGTPDLGLVLLLYIE